MILLNRRHAIWFFSRYEVHFNEERPHRGLELSTPAAKAESREPPMLNSVPKIRRKDVLGGLIHEYERVAA